MERPLYEHFHLIFGTSTTDLSDQHFDGHPYATRRSVNHMIRAGLIEEHEATGPEGQSFKVLTGYQAKSWTTPRRIVAKVGAPPR